jgi:hypothetical protein
MFISMLLLVVSLLFFLKLGNVFNCFFEISECIELHFYTLSDAAEFICKILGLLMG